MIKRPWDKNNAYLHGFIKQQKYWTLEVSGKQHTLGCLILFLNRKEQHFSKLKPAETRELIKIMGEIEHVLFHKFKHDRMNYLQLGNTLHWLHIHCVPRYQTPRTYLGKKWIDAEPGRPVQWLRSDSPRQLVTDMANELKQELNK